jgi:hypothetical protein
LALLVGGGGAVYLVLVIVTGAVPRADLLRALGRK